MAPPPTDSASGSHEKRLVSCSRLVDILFVLIGVGALVAKGWFRDRLILDYGGNVAASFATYFLLKLPSVPTRYRAATAIALALLATELFEATNGFYFMTNTYDSADYFANAAGVAFAFAVDFLVVKYVCGTGAEAG